MKKINIAELLKDCPKGMKLYSPLCGECELYAVIQGSIHVNTKSNKLRSFYSNGCYMQDGECVLFPSKENRDWSTFQRPFKDGDILATDLGSVFYLNKRLNTDECYGCYVGIGGDGSFHICVPFAYKECCGLATEKEKQKLFKAIKDNGYKWNPETKALEKLEVNKFDITTLKPFDKVLVRDTSEYPWHATFYSHHTGTYFYSTNGLYAQCIPFDDNKHLLGTKDDCDDYYKTWE